MKSIDKIFLLILSVAFLSLGCNLSGPEFESDYSNYFPSKSISDSQNLDSIRRNIDIYNKQQKGITIAGSDYPKPLNPPPAFGIPIGGGVYTKPISYSSSQSSATQSNPTVAPPVLPAPTNTIKCFDITRVFSSTGVDGMGTSVRKEAKKHGYAFFVGTERSSNKKISIKIDLKQVIQQQKICIDTRQNPIPQGIYDIAIFAQGAPFNIENQGIIGGLANIGARKGWNSYFDIYNTTLTSNGGADLIANSTIAHPNLAVPITGNRIPMLFDANPLVDDQRTWFKPTQVANSNAPSGGSSGFGGGGPGPDIQYSPLAILWEDSKEYFTSQAKGVNFDINGDKSPEKIGWITRYASLLAIDLNNNGKIDSGAELFGNFSNNQQFNNGFAALKMYDSNNDGQISKLDKDFEKLVLWQDRNSNGISEKKELIKLSSVISSIDLNYAVKSETDKYGNTIRERSTVKTVKGKTLPIVDVWFTASDNIVLN